MQPFITKHTIAIALVVLFGGGGVLAYNRFSAETGHPENNPSLQGTSATTPVTTVPVETAADGDVEKLGATSVSWPGEILSTADVQIFSAREGQIAEWRVRLGQRVYQGQVLGRLSAAPVSSELVNALAERQQAIVRARANVEATVEFIRTSKQQLNELKLALDLARDAAISAADKNLQALLGAVSSTVSSFTPVSADSGIVTLKRDQVRTVARQIVQHYIDAIGIHFISANPDNLLSNFRLKRNVGRLDPAAENTFLNSARQLLTDLGNPTALTEASTLEFLKSTRRLLLASVGTSSDVDDALTDTELAELRDKTGIFQIQFLAAINEYKESLISIENVRGERNKLVTTAQADYAEKKAELDKKTGELDRELKLAQAEVQAAQAGYSTVASGIAGQNIVAPKSGVVSVILKNIGDHATPDMALAGISSAEAKGRFVRFRIPSDIRLPEVGEEVTIERPGFPLNGKKAKVVGVGLALDANGSYSAEAEFVEAINWPVHASVRVTGTHAANTVLIPFTAVWWDDKEMSHVWLVMENNVIRPQAVRVGRAVGDRVDVEEGLQIGDRFVSKPTLELKTGQSIAEVGNSTPTAKPAITESPTGDGHGHAHDE